MFIKIITPWLNPQSILKICYIYKLYNYLIKKMYLVFNVLYKFECMY